MPNSSTQGTDGWSLTHETRGPFKKSSISVADAAILVKC